MTPECTPAQAYQRILTWRNGRGSSFSCKLFELLQKADPENSERLIGAFPIQSAVFYEWYYSKDEEFFLERARRLLREGEGCLQ